MADLADAEHSRILCVSQELQLGLVEHVPVDPPRALRLGVDRGVRSLQCSPLNFWAGPPEAGDDVPLAGAIQETPCQPGGSGQALRPSGTSRSGLQIEHPDVE